MRTETLFEPCFAAIAAVAMEKTAAEMGSRRVARFNPSMSAATVRMTHTHPVSVHGAPRHPNEMKVTALDRTHAIVTQLVYILIKISMTSTSRTESRSVWTACHALVLTWNNIHLIMVLN